MAQYALPLFEPEGPRKAPQTALPQRQRLWFCIYLPNLPLEAVACRDGAKVVVEEQQGIHRVVLADGRAKKAGILTELRRREYYEKPTQERKRRKAAAVKRHAKRLQREQARRRRLY